jgi:hypothetical protein
MNQCQRFFFGIFSASALALCAAAGRAATLVVDLSGGGDFTAIQPAIDTAQAVDTVLVKAGEHVITEPISFRGKEITVRAEAGPEATTIRMSETPANPNWASVVVFESGETAASRLDGFKLTGGNGPIGSGVPCHSSSPTLTNFAEVFLLNCFPGARGFDVLTAGQPVLTKLEPVSLLRRCDRLRSWSRTVFSTSSSCRASRTRGVGDRGGAGRRSRLIHY